jgi:hypothetical protein
VGLLPNASESPKNLVQSLFDSGEVEAPVFGFAMGEHSSFLNIGAFNYDLMAGEISWLLLPDSQDWWGLSVTGIKIGAEDY